MPAGELEFACCQARKRLARVSCLLLHNTTGTTVEDGGEGVGDICWLISWSLYNILQIQWSAIQKPENGAEGLWYRVASWYRSSCLVGNGGWCCAPHYFWCPAVVMQADRWWVSQYYSCGYFWVTSISHWNTCRQSMGITEKMLFLHPIRLRCSQ